MKRDVLQIIFFGLLPANVCLFFYFFRFQTYPLPLLLFHIATLVFLWLLVLKKVFEKRTFWNIDTLIVIMVFFIAFFIRIYHIDVVTPGMWGDEISVALAGEKTLALSSFHPYIPQYIGHPTPLLYLVGLSIHFFGKTIMAIRLQSVLFGCLDVCMFFIFLRLFFKRPISFLVSCVFLVSYSHLVLSRFAYDMTAAIFFQILTLLFLTKAYSKDDLRYYAGIGLSIGAGLFTYYSFRSFALLFFALSIFLIFKRPKADRMKKIGIMLATLFIASILLLSADLRNTNDLLARTKAISVFNQGFSSSRVMQELGGNVKNDFGALFFVGDPTPRQNPSNTSLFDFLTMVLAYCGLAVLFKKNKRFFWISLLIILFSLLNDIFTVEIFPEFHFYGTGHPNILRISGIIPVFYFLVGYALKGIQNLFRNAPKQYAQAGLALLTLAMMFLNWALYFSQPPSPYNYKYDGARMIKIADIMNHSSGKVIFASPAIVHDQRAAYFLSPDKHMESFQITTVDQTIKNLEKNKLTIIDPEKNTPVVQSLVEKIAKEKTPLQQTILQNPWGGADAVIYTH